MNTCAAGMASLPESPRWLLLSGRSTAEASDALRRVQGGRIASEEALEVRTFQCVKACMQDTCGAGLGARMQLHAGQVPFVQAPVLGPDTVREVQTMLLVV